VQAVVLAGGLATRMRPHTLSMPKSMLEVAGRPFVDWQLERLAGSGLREVVMCIAHLGEQIKVHVGDGARYGLHVRWSEDGGKLLGTAGALRAALHLLAPTFLVMAIYKNDGKWDQSNVMTDGAWVIRYDKHVPEGAFDHIDYGATALRREIIAALPAGESHGLDALGYDLARQKRLRACVARERFFEIGSPEGLADLDRYLQTRASPS
jgi:MurNAc alpha-1-phosphate uridylyltransferase